MATITLFFYRNKVYKNNKPQISEKSKERLEAQLSNIGHLFLSLNLQAQNPEIGSKQAYFDQI